MIRAYLRWLRAEVAHVPWASGLRGYCWACDDLRWAWTHRRCGRRAHAVGARLAANPGVRAALAEMAHRDDPEGSE